MTIEEARTILGEKIKEDNSLDDLSQYLSWNVNSKEACLDAYFTADELEAIAVWMRRYKQ